jgi:hypothetical protein
MAKLIDKVLLYISAAADLVGEREVLGRAVTEVPVELGWRIVQSPGRDDPVDLAAVVQADVHLLIMGSDIRAPIGQEWVAARRAGRLPALFLKQGVLRTPAAQEFRRYIEAQAQWQAYRGPADLRGAVLRLLAGHFLDRAVSYALTPGAVMRLQAWREELGAASEAGGEVVRGGAGESGVVLSPERYVPADGVLIQPGQKEAGQSSSSGLGVVSLDQAAVPTSLGLRRSHSAGARGLNRAPSCSRSVPTIRG